MSIYCDVVHWIQSNFSSPLNNPRRTNKMKSTICDIVLHSKKSLNKSDITNFIEIIKNEKNIFIEKVDFVNERCIAISLHRNETIQQIISRHQLNQSIIYDNAIRLENSSSEEKLSPCQSITDLNNSLKKITLAYFKQTIFPISDSFHIWLNEFYQRHFVNVYHDESSKGNDFEKMKFYKIRFEIIHQCYLDKYQHEKSTIELDELSHKLTRAAIKMELLSIKNNNEKEILSEENLFKFNEVLFILYNIVRLGKISKNNCSCQEFSDFSKINQILSEQNEWELVWLYLDRFVDERNQLSSTATSARNDIYDCHSDKTIGSGNNKIFHLLSQFAHTFSAFYSQYRVDLLPLNKEMKLVCKARRFLCENLYRELTNLLQILNVDLIKIM